MVIFDTIIITISFLFGFIIGIVVTKEHERKYKINKNER